MQQIPVELMDKQMKLKGKPLFTFKLLELVFANLCSKLAAYSQSCCDFHTWEFCLSASWSTFSHLLLAIYGAQLSQQDSMTFVISNVDPFVRKEVASSIRYLSAIQYVNLNWTPFAKTNEWSDDWTLKTSCLGVLHEDQREQIRITLKGWRFGGGPLQKLPAEILMEILILISSPPYVFCKRCFCCNKFVSGFFQCNWCIENVYFCNADCQKQAKDIHCCRKKAQKCAKVDAPVSANKLPPVLSDRDNNYVEMIRIRYPEE